MQGPQPLALITFDVDDTLYSTTGFVNLARENAVRAMQAVGLRGEFEHLMSELREVIQEFTSNDEHHFDRLLQRLSPENLVGLNSAIAVAAGVAAYRDAVVRHLAPYEDVMDSFRRMHAQGYRLGIISQGYTIKQAEKLVRLRILPFLDRQAIFISDQLGMSKANPRLFLRVAERLGVRPEQCLHVGDRPDRDVDSANRAGWITVLNRRSGSYHERPAATPPAFTIQNFWDLLEILEKHFSPRPGPGNSPGPADQGEARGMGPA